MYLMRMLVCVLAATVPVLVGCSSTEKSSSSGSGGATTQSVPASNLDDWLREVCKPGTYQNGGARVLRNSDAGGTCLSLVSDGPRPIMMGQYSSDFSLENDVAIMKGADYATLQTDNGFTQLFLSLGGSSASGKANVFQSLAKYGFTIGSVPRR